MSLAREELEAFVKRLAADPGRWRPLVQHHPDKRTYGLIWEDDDVNAWVLCWSTDHDTGFHDHDVSTAAITVIEGQVREDRLRLDGSARESFTAPARASRFPREAIHRVLHTGEGPAVTIHAYSHRRCADRARTLPGDDGVLQRHIQSWEEELTGQLLIAAA